MDYPIIIAGLPITEIRVTPLVDKGKLRALVNITFGGVLALKGAKVIEGSTGLFVAMSNQKQADTWKDNYHMLTSESNKALCDIIMLAYNESINK